jgi:hypothetical protein
MLGYLVLYFSITVIRDYNLVHNRLCEVAYSLHRLLYFVKQAFLDLANARLSRE